jgi:hypothetical protein
MIFEAHLFINSAFSSFHLVGNEWVSARQLLLPAGVSFIFFHAPAPQIYCITIFIA